jgi:(4-(4-[2-(gamma-L-glutamylamino)ethyl]phenoxymethyl)furan-2-yl)methanamine synthase
MHDNPAVLGWDIGGVNLKAARFPSGSGTALPKVVCRPLEIQHVLPALATTLCDVARELGGSPGDQHAVTMTAELSQAFRTKREGVGYVLDALESSFPSGSLHVYTAGGEFVSSGHARQHPLTVAASNWMATACWVSQRFPNSLLIDMGSTSTDLIPIVEGEVTAIGRNDPERLQNGELLYTGLVRTPIEAIVHQVPLWDGDAGVSAEGFALIGDAYVWLGRIRPEDYTWRTPDGRPATREYAGERLARMVCADREMLNESDIDVLASAVAGAQVEMIRARVRQIRARHPSIALAVVTGMGAEIATQAAEAAGLKVVSLGSQLGIAPQATPAAAVASLLSAQLLRQARA